MIEGAPEGFVESGEPLIAVLGPENLGVRLPPSDIHRMPDGRMLLVAGQDLAIGDGVRWQVFHHQDEDHPVLNRSVIVSDEGKIFAGIPGGFGHVEFGEDDRWRFVLDAETIPEKRGAFDIALYANAVGSEWFWHSGSGMLVSWRPGGETVGVGSTGFVERVFFFRGEYYLSDWTDGSLLQLKDGRFQTIIPAEQSTSGDAITCTTGFDEKNLLVGTPLRGIRLFDGKQTKPFVEQGLLSGGRRINDLCGIEGGLFAAAVENYGLVFFDRSGNILQVLGRSSDRRLTRPHRLLAMPGGVVWALLNEGIARVQFPTRVTQYAPLINTPLATAHVYRLDGRLWIVADGIVQRGLYDRLNRLERMEPDSPPVEFVFSLSTAPGWPLAGTEKGFFGKIDGQWKNLEPNLINGRILSDKPVDGRWLYGARGGLGWIRFNGNKLEFEHFEVPGIKDVYGAKRDAKDNLWIELGPGAACRVPLKPGPIEPEMFNMASGLPNNWAQIFELDGVVRVNASGTIVKFDAQTRRFVEDREFVQKFSPNQPIVGRPARDALGLIWLTAGDDIHVFDDSSGSLKRVDERLPPAVRPIYFTPETNGVVWMHAARKLVRYDPRMPDTTPLVPRAMITSVHLSLSNRTLYTNGDELGPLPYADNSLAFEFLAPGNPFGDPVVFEIILEGSRGVLTSTVISSPAVFNRLHEDDYVLHVRPRAGRVEGTDATLTFSILPPWYRTTAAYIGYIFSAIAIVAISSWVFTILERREKARLERVVTFRTNELEQKAAALAASEDRYRTLSKDLEKRVDERTSELHGANEQLLASNRELEAFSYSVSHDLRAPLRNIRGFASLLERRAEPVLDGESKRFLGIVSNESTRLAELIDSLLAFSRLNRAELQKSDLDLRPLIDATRTDLEQESHGRSVEWIIGDLPRVHGDPTLVRQVLTNLISNALKFTRTRDPAVITIGSSNDSGNNGETILYVRDNGVGFDPAYAEKLFGVFQSLHSRTEFEGSGIGLATVKRIVTRHGGHIWAEGVPNSGATVYFTMKRAKSA